MFLTALISAYHDAEPAGSGLRATLPLAGRSLVERQARLAIEAGAAAVIILVERVPADLATAIDRMRGEGIATQIARSAGEASEALERGAKLLVIGDGLIADPRTIARMADLDAPAILTLPDNLVDDRHERIDAGTRWAGLAVADGALLVDTAAMLGEWDLQSTLLRRLVQQGARQIAVRPDNAEGPLLIAMRIEDLAGVEQAIVTAASSGARGWASRLLLAPIERLLTHAAMPSAVTPAWIHFTAIVLTGVSIPLFAKGWLWAGSLTMLLATPLDGTAKRLALLRLEGGRRAGWWNWILPSVAAGVLVALAHSLSATFGWGCYVLAGTALLFLMALRGELADAPAADEWVAERKGIIWLMLPFAISGQWPFGLGVIAAYAAGSFFWAQRIAHGRAPQRD